MSGKVGFLVCLLLPIAVFQVDAGTENLSPAAQWVPSDAVICMELSRPRALLDVFADEKTCKAIEALPIYQRLKSTSGFRDLLGAVKLLEVSLDTDWRTGLAKLTGGGITFAVCPDDVVVIIIDAEDGRMLERLHEVMLTLAQSEAAKQGLPGRVAQAEYEGVESWTFNGREAHAIIGRRFVIANSPEALKTVLRMRRSDAEASLAQRADYLAAKKAVGTGAVAMTLVNLEVVRYIPAVSGLLAQDKKNPLTALLFAGITEAIRNSGSPAFGLQVEQDRLILQAYLDGAGVDPAGPAGFAVPGKPAHGVMPNLSPPRTIAALSMYRDLHRFYAFKDELFAERTSGLIFFENMMGIFFSGRDLTDEVLAETTPDVRFVVARQEYDDTRGIPATRIPAFALVIRLRNAGEFDEVVEEAWQKAIGLINFTRGQQAMPGLIMDRPVHNGTRFTVARFSTAGLEQTAQLDTRFNFRPALAVTGDYLILSSTDGLARDLIDALKQQDAVATGPLAGIHTLAELNGAELAAILQANYEAMVRQNMVNEGNSRQAAETAIDMLITLARLAGRVELSVGTQDRLTKARLEIRPGLQQHVVVDRRGVVRVESKVSR